MLAFVPGTIPPEQYQQRCYVVYSDNDLLVADGLDPWQPIEDSTWRFCGIAPQQQVYLGSYRQQRAYAISVNQADTPAPPGFHWEPLRSLLGRGAIEETEFNLVGCGLQLFHWDRDHQFCGRCGNATNAHQKDRARTCETCQIDFYPRLSPCVIMLISRGEECLLARHARSKANFYSTLAGFIEPGESVENALRREVMEEVGVQVQNLRFFTSQPWPFPGQLMLGFNADYHAGEIVIDDDEIEDAQWWHYRDLPPVPPAGTLSGKLIQHFVDQMKLSEK